MQDDEEDEDWKAWGNELEGDTQDVAGSDGSPQLVFVQLKPKAVRKEKNQQELAKRYRAFLQLGGYSETVFPVAEDRLFLSIRKLIDVPEVRHTQRERERESVCACVCLCFNAFPSLGKTNRSVLLG